MMNMMMLCQQASELNMDDKHDMNIRNINIFNWKMQ